MAEQILLQGKILGTEEFLLAGSAEGRSARSAGEDLVTGRSQWIALLCEVLPRALLADLGLSRILLGSSGGGQFLVVLPGEAREAAETFLSAAAAADRGLECRSRPPDLGHYRQPGGLGRNPQAAQGRAGSQAQRSSRRFGGRSVQSPPACVQFLGRRLFRQGAWGQAARSFGSGLVAGRTRKGHPWPGQI